MPVKNTVRGRKINPEKAALAKEFRRNPTEAEDILWQRLRRNQLDGWHFRRQQVIGGFIVDFYCHEAELIIEVDGPIHEQQIDEDMSRDLALTALGYRVVRISNDDILSNIDVILHRLREAAQVSESGSSSPPL